MGFQRYKKRFFKNAVQTYKSIDIYAKDLTLTFEGEDKHTTYVGATLTTMILIFMIIYAGFQLETMFKRKQTTVNLKSVYQDLTKNYDNISLSDYGFDLALQLSSDGNTTYDESIYKFKVLNINSYWQTNSNGVATRIRQETELPLHICTDYNGTDDDISRLGINKTYWCPQKKDYSIGGSFQAPNYRYVEVQVFKCHSKIGTATCDSDQTKIDEFINNGRLSVAYNNFYFDSDDYDSPVKRFIDDKLWVNLMADRMKDSDVFVRQNEISLQDGYVQITGEEKKEFISISGARETFDNIWSDWPKVAGLFFRVDTIKDSYERQVYSSGDLLAQVGGIFSFLKVIGGVLVYIFSERLLVASLAGKLYQVYDNKPDVQEKGYKPHSFDNGDSIVQINHSSNKIHDISAVSLVNEEDKLLKKRNPVRNIFKNALYCQTKTDIISNKLKDNKRLDDVDRLKIKNLVTCRKRFNYNSFHVLQYIICCVACRQRRNKKKWKRHLLYKKAEDKVFEQLDVVNILKWIEQLKLLTKVLLNNKQKFWLKFQKEHILEIDNDSDFEIEKKWKEFEQGDRDFIRRYEKKDPQAVERMNKMLQNLEYGNRSNFDQKILMGLFEEYASNSDEEENVNRVMNSDEERKEFYSLSINPERKKQFNSNKDNDDQYDLSNLKNLYNNPEESLLYIGARKKFNSQATIQDQKHKQIRKKTKLKSSMLDQVTGSKGAFKSKSFNKGNKEKPNKKYLKIKNKPSPVASQNVEPSDSASSDSAPIEPPKPDPYTFTSIEQKMKLIRAAEVRQMEEEEEKENERKKQERKRKKEEQKRKEQEEKERKEKERKEKEEEEEEGKEMKKEEEEKEMKEIEELELMDEAENLDKNKMNEDEEKEVERLMKEEGDKNEELKKDQWMEDDQKEDSNRDLIKETIEANKMLPRKFDSP
ncbi:unnamed protein product [Moneuplotes crassus]|uniref:Uncharacterized protein n=1 Tax=Euplotes crassus TaxID=5936 RepID=A0AAD1XZK4_EUPCR|nr:unnamed protein product [Moneuplotes crassus]